MKLKNILCLPFIVTTNQACSDAGSDNPTVSNNLTKRTVADGKPVVLDAESVTTVVYNLK